MKITLPIRIKIRKIAIRALTGAKDNALNINKAPNMSIEKPINQALFKAYALITYKHKVTYKMISSLETSSNTFIMSKNNLTTFPTHKNSGTKLK